MKIHNIAKIFTICAACALVMGTVAAADIDVNEQTTYEGAALVGSSPVFRGLTQTKVGAPGIELVEGLNSMKLTGSLTSSDRLFTLVHEGNILYSQLNVDDGAAEYGHIDIKENIGSMGLGADVENLEQLSNGLDENLPEDTVAAVTRDSLIAMSDYMLAAGEAFYWDFSGYGAQFAGTQVLMAAMDSDQVPEPAAWLMLMLGMAGLFAARQVNSRRKQEMLHA